MPVENCFRTEKPEQPTFWGTLGVPVRIAIISQEGRWSMVVDLDCIIRAGGSE